MCCLTHHANPLFDGDFLDVDSVATLDLHEVKAFRGIPKVDVLCAGNMVHGHNDLSQHIVDGDMALFFQFEGKVARRGVGVEDIVLRLALYHGVDDTGVWEGDVVDPGAVGACLVLAALVVEPE